MSRLTAGDPAPWFIASTPSNPQFNFQAAAGRHVVLCFHGAASQPRTRAMLEALEARRDLFNDDHASFFGVVRDPDDIRAGHASQREPGFRFFADPEGRIAKLYGATKPQTLVLDRTLRVVATLAIADPVAHVTQLCALVAALPARGKFETARSNAPVLVVPRVFEPEFCRALIELYARTGGEDSGFMRNGPDGKTVGVLDHGHKRRRDCLIEDEDLRNGVRARIERRLVPEIRKAFMFNPTRIERYIVACYDAGEGGYFRAHRDNTTRGTAHRRFAVTLNLNAEEYEGGDLRFPEYDDRGHRAPTGGAVVFGCSLMHEALPVKKGTRYCVLPFLYDEAGARVRAENAAFLDDPKLREVAVAWAPKPAE